jgi:hypothetical protein
VRNLSFVHLSHDTLADILRLLYYLYAAIFLYITRIVPYGTNIFTRDWDLLIVLDACRLDAIEQLADEYDFLDEISSIRSVGSMSGEWMNNTFRTKHTNQIAGTAMITQNPYTQLALGNGGYTDHIDLPFGPSKYDVVSPDSFAYLEECWRLDEDSVPEWTIGEGDNEAISPDLLTDRIIRAAREGRGQKIIAHYMYPHDPYPNADIDLLNVFESFKRGEISRETLWNAYIDNLRTVLDSVDLLLSNVDAEKVVITSDHGEAFGEWGFYKHIIACPIKQVRRVPWVETSATDSGAYDPIAPGPDTVANISVDHRLRNLGYL